MLLVLAVQVAGSILEGTFHENVGEVVPAEGNVPVVFLHGMGDASTNPGMASICKSVTEKYPGTYVHCSPVGNGLKSITTVLATQVEQFTQDIRSDPKLAGGFHAVGLSQGNLVIRAYIEQVNDPPVKQYISMCGPHGGVGQCPDNILYKLACPIWKLDKYHAPIAFADYWKDSSNKAEYLQKSRWLADINNERDTKNATYKQNMLTLENYVLVEAMKDSMVEPHVSEEHAFFKWGSTTETETLLETEAYQGDWLGLKTLDTQKKLTIMTYEGDHLRWTQEFWNEKILPYFAPKKSSVVV